MHVNLAVFLLFSEIKSDILNECGDDCIYAKMLNIKICEKGVLKWIRAMK